MNVYSLVNTPTLVRDLARHARGATVATDLLRALALTDGDLADLDKVRMSPAAAERRAAVLTQLASPARALTVLAAARDVAESTGLRAWSAAADVLDAAAIGGADDLVRFVRHDVLDRAWSVAGDVAVARHPTALDVVADGVVAGYAVGATADLARPLGRPWRRWLSARSFTPAPVDGAAGDLVYAIRRAAPQRLTHAASALRRQRADGWSWPDAMHEACWAVHLTGRERVAAVAQLHALRALLGVVAERPSPDVVAAVVAAVHATVVSDVLNVMTEAAMTAPLHAALG